MEVKKFKDKVHNVLKKENRLWNEEKTELNQTLLLDILENFNEKNLELYESVISLFLEDEELKSKFFLKVKDVFVFKTSDFKFFMEENKVYNSFTQYKNRIGLTDGKRFLKDSADVVLNFPYKDCVLEGGQSTEEGLDYYYEYDETISKTDEKKGYKAESYNLKQSKRNEVFFNQILAKDEIDRLFDKKVFINWKRFTTDGEVSVGEIKRDEDGTIKENLIIKGNNLLALHTLKAQFKGKVKIIYLDPPYNTGKDGFNYNDRFNHSTWLTFIKNRLEIAKELLKDDGVIYISLDDKELHYLKVLLDEIFGRENFIGNIAWESKTKSQNTKDSFNKLQPKIEHILLYTKKTCRRFNLINRGEKEYPLKDKKGKYREYTLELMNSDGIRGRSTMVFEIEGINPPEGQQWKLGKDTITMYRNRNDLFVRDDKIVIKKRPEDEDSELTEPFWGLFKKDIGTAESAKKELTKLLFPYKHGFETVKPVELIKRLIFHASNENDIILDFFGGSGTTGHSVLKLNNEDFRNRKFILIEQMDYISTITIPRIKKVLEIKNISDSFIYCELAPYNEKAKEEINNCNTLDELEKLFDTLYDKYFLNYNLKVKEFKEKVIKEENFKALTLEQQKEMFLTMLDLNQMYVQYSEMKDNKYGIDKVSQELTNKFYSDK